MVYETMSLATQVQAPKLLQVAPGDTVQFALSWKYVGPAVLFKLRVCIGLINAIGGFDEWRGPFVETEFNQPAMSSETGQKAQINITLPSNLVAGKYDIYAKILGPNTPSGGLLTPYYQQAIEVLSAAKSAFSNLIITDYYKMEYF